MPQESILFRLYHGEVLPVATIFFNCKRSSYWVGFLLKMHLLRIVFRRLCTTATQEVKKPKEKIRTKIGMATFWAIIRKTISAWHKCTPSPVCRVYLVSSLGVRKHDPRSAAWNKGYFSLCIKYSIPWISELQRLMSDLGPSLHVALAASAYLFQYLVVKVVFCYL